MADLKNNIMPILIGIKRDTKGILDAFSSGVTHIADRVVRQSQGTAERAERARVRVNRARGAGSSQKPDIKVVVKLEDSGKSSFAETKKVRTKQKGTNSVNFSRKPGKVSAQPSGKIGADTGAVDTSPGKILARTRKAGARVPSALAAAVVSGGKKRDAAGRFLKGGSKSQQALEDKKQRAAFAEQEEGVIGRANSFLTKLFGAGSELAKNADAGEAVGLATLGPITGAVSEMAQLGSSMKDSVTGVIGKFKGDGGEKVSKHDAKQLEVEQETLDTTIEVRDALVAGDDDQKDRDKKLLAATKGANKKSGKVMSALGKVMGGGEGSGGMIKSVMGTALAGGAALAIGGVVGSWIDDKITKALGGVTLGEWLEGKVSGP